MTTLLVINDDPIQLHFLASLLEKDYEMVMRFTCANEAWQWLQDGHVPDGIVLDLHMPGINGWQFCELLHTQWCSGGRVPPVLIVSATYAGLDAKDLLKDMGASDFLSLPAEPSRIRQHVRQLLEEPVASQDFQAWMISADDAEIERIRGVFTERGWQVHGWANGAQVQSASALPDPDIVIVNLPVSDMTTEDLLSWCLREYPEAMCVVMGASDGTRPFSGVMALSVVSLPTSCDALTLMALCDKWRWERALARVEGLLEVRTRDLQQSEAQFRELFEILPDVLVIYDGQGVIQHMNTSGASQLGYVPHELKGLSFEKIHSSPFHDSLERKHVEGEDRCLNWSEAQLRRKDGSNFPVEILERAVRFQGHLHTLMIARDMSVRQNMAQENATLEHQLRQVQKMEAVGRLASGVAHDMNNILTAILAHAGLLKARGEAQDPSWIAGDVIEKAVHRGKELTSQLLGFARQGKHHHVPVDIHRVIQEVISLLGRTVEKTITLKENLFAKESWVVGDPNQLYQVLMNLAVNASDAMPDKGDIMFHTGNETVSSEQASQVPGLEPGEYVVVRVSDTGEGIPQDVQAQIFEPFFTTKEQGKGTGMGLAMVYGIVKNHHGYIGVTSTLGVGTTMRVYLPSVLCEESQVKDEPAASPSEGTGHVLIIDDEKGVAEAAQAILEFLGYTTTMCLGGREAVDFYHECSHQVDLVLLDMVMPGMSGSECCAELRRIQPTSKIVLCTGYDRNHAVQELLDQGVAGFIQKPYDVDALAHVCADVLKQHDSAEPCLSGSQV